jgi:hypothetical protein
MEQMSRFSPDSLGLTLAGGGCATYPPGATYGPRRLLDWEFVWLLEGNATYLRAARGIETESPAPQGTLVLCRPCDEAKPTRLYGTRKSARATPFSTFAAIRARRLAASVLLASRAPDAAQRLETGAVSPGADAQ